MSQRWYYLNSIRCNHIRLPLTHTAVCKSYQHALYEVHLVHLQLRHVTVDILCSKFKNLTNKTGPSDVLDVPRLLDPKLHDTPSLHVDAASRQTSAHSSSPRLHCPAPWSGLVRPIHNGSLTSVDLFKHVSLPPTTSIRVKTLSYTEQLVRQTRGKEQTTHQLRANVIVSGDPVTTVLWANWKITTIYDPGKSWVSSLRENICFTFFDYMF